MNINDLTIGQAKEIAAQFTGKLSNNHPYEIGKNYFIRTVTHYYTGRLSAVYEHELVITDAAWIADTGRYSDALASGDFSEVEPYPVGDVIVGRGALLDASQLSTTLPRSQK